MSFVVSVASWLFIHTIYGILGVAAVGYAISRALKKVWPRFPEPFAVAALVFVLGICTLPSIPRYQFQRETLAKIEGKEWLRVVSKAKWGSVTEPLTWVNAPLGSVTVVMPNLPTEGGFRQVTWRYEEEPTVSLIEADCGDSTIMYSRPDKQGVFRYATPSPVKMTGQEKGLYCEYNWANEKEALRREYLRQEKDRGRP